MAVSLIVKSLNQFRGAAPRDKIKFYNYLIKQDIKTKTCLIFVFRSRVQCEHGQLVGRSVGCSVSPSVRPSIHTTKPAEYRGLTLKFNPEKIGLNGGEQ